MNYLIQNVNDKAPDRSPATEMKLLDIFDKSVRTEVAEKEAKRAKDEKSAAERRIVEEKAAHEITDTKLREAAELSAYTGDIT